MAERKATNKYYPPEWTPSMGSVNQMLGQHPLRERAKKLDQGILVIRFEMPFNIWCGGCGRHIAMSVRFNAEKKKVGNYFSTPIYDFTCKCASCSNKIVMRNDPENCQYVVVSGGKRKMETWEAADSEVIELKDDVEAEKLASDPFYKLEHADKDQKKVVVETPKIQALQALNKRHSDALGLSQLVRKKFRTEKHEIKLAKQAEIADQKRLGVSIPLLPPSEVDAALASSVKFDRLSGFSENKREKRHKIRSSSIFDGPLASSTASPLALPSTTPSLSTRPPTTTTNSTALTTTKPAKTTAAHTATPPHTNEHLKKLALAEKARKLGIDHSLFARPKSAPSALAAAKVVVKRA